MFELSACIEWLFCEAGESFEARIGSAAAAGVPAVEFWGWRGRDSDGIGRALRDTGVKLTAFAVDPPVPLADPSARDAAVTAIAESAAAAAGLGCHNMIVVSGDRDERISASEQRAAIVTVLDHAAPLAAERDVTLLLEPLNTRIDHVGTFLDSTCDAFGIIDEVGAANVKILFDLYHAAVMGERLEEVLAGRVAEVGHVHIADAPGRHEPGTGKVDWAGAFAWLHEHGYEGRIGLEYVPIAPTRDTLEVLRGFLTPT
jgi:hydroxypyruvate isomerase